MKTGVQSNKMNWYWLLVLVANAAIANKFWPFVCERIVPCAGGQLHHRYLTTTRCLPGYVDGCRQAALTAWITINLTSLSDKVPVEYSYS